MKVKELQAILTEWHPDEEVCLFSASKKYMVMFGLNRIESEVSKCCVIDCDWSKSDMPIESESDKLRRERDAIDEQMDELTKRRAEVATEIVKADKREYRKNGSKKKAKAKRGATRRALTKGQDTQPKKRGRPRKTDQETDQSIDSQK